MEADQLLRLIRTKPLYCQENRRTYVFTDRPRPESMPVNKQHVSEPHWVCEVFRGKEMIGQYAYTVNKQGINCFIHFAKQSAFFIGHGSKGLELHVMGKEIVRLR